MGNSPHKAILRRRLLEKSRGQVFTLIAIGLFVLIGFGALAVDVGTLWIAKHRMQSAADAAALAGTDELSIQMTSLITSAAQSASAQNGFPNGSGSSTSSYPVSVAVYNPPQDGPFSGNANAVQVKITEDQGTGFMGVLGWSKVPVSANAVGITVSGGSCVYALDPSAPGTVTLSGGGTLNSSCGVYDNSNSGSALTVSGGGTITAPFVGVVGGTNLNGGGSSPPVSGIAAFGDPLAWVQAPSTGSCSSYNQKSINITTTLNPGLYCGGIKINSGANVTFNPGTYIIDGGGLTVLSSAVVNGSGVTFYLTGQNNKNSNPSSYAGINIAGSATVNLSAPCAGASGGIEGMLFFQDRSITTDMGSVINGGSNSTFAGAVYFPTTPLSYSGSSGSQYTLLVADTITINGASSIGNNYSCLSGGSSLIKNASLVQ